MLVASSCPRHRARGFKAHIHTGTLAGGSLVSLCPGVRCVTPLLATVQLAPRLSGLELQILLAELLGGYALGTPDSEEAKPRSRPLYDLGMAGQQLGRLGPLPGTALVRAGLVRCPVGAASIMEAKLYLRATARFASGGYRLGTVVLNSPVELGRISSDIATLRTRKPDLLLLAPPESSQELPFRGVALDYKGSWHADAEQIRRDDDRQNELLAHNVKDYVLWKEQYDDLDYLDGLMAAIRHDLGLPERRASRERLERERQARWNLWAELERIDGVHWSFQQALGA